MEVLGTIAIMVLVVSVVTGILAGYFTKKKHDRRKMSYIRHTLYDAKPKTNYLKSLDDFLGSLSFNELEKLHAKVTSPYYDALRLTEIEGDLYVIFSLILSIISNYELNLKQFHDRYKIELTEPGTQVYRELTKKLIINKYNEKK